jgi:RNA polymerase sigma-70 factor (ECF subfamily)
LPSSAPTPEELSHWLARSALGDRAAFERLYEATCGRLFAVVLRIQRDRGLAEELLQEVYVTVWRSAGGFDAARSQPLTWLTAIARNRAIDSLRRGAVRPDINLDEHDADTVASPQPGPNELLQRAFERRLLGDCLERLSAPQRQSVALAFYDGLTHAEIAQHLREPLGTVKAWLRRSLLALRDCLDGHAAGIGERGGR